MFAALGEAWPTFDGFVHSIGFAPKEAIAGDFLEGLSREAFRIAHDISSYSFPALAKAAAPRLRARRGAPHPDLSGGAAQRSQLQHDGPGQGLARGQRALPGGQPRPARASASTASRPGRSRRWPPRASRASARSSTSSTQNAPLRRNVTIDDVGNVAAFLLSDLAAGVTSEIIYVDGGFSHAMPARLAGHAPRRPLPPRSPPSERRAAPTPALTLSARSRRSTCPSSTPTPSSSIIDIRPWTSVSKPGKRLVEGAREAQVVDDLAVEASRPGSAAGCPGGYGVSSVVEMRPSSCVDRRPARSCGGRCRRRRRSASSPAAIATGTCR